MVAAGTDLSFQSFNVVHLRITVSLALLSQLVRAVQVSARRGEKEGRLKAAKAEKEPKKTAEPS